MATNHLTDDQIRETLARMTMRPDLKAVLLKQCLSGDAGARFLVYHHFRAQQVPAATRIATRDAHVAETASWMRR